MPRVWEAWKLGFSLAHRQKEALVPPQSLSCLWGSAQGLQVPTASQNSNCCVPVCHVSREVVPGICYCHCLKNNNLVGPAVPWKSLSLAFGTEICQQYMHESSHLSFILLHEWQGSRLCIQLCFYPFKCIVSDLSKGRSKKSSRMEIVYVFHDSKPCYWGAGWGGGCNYNCFLIRDFAISSPLIGKLSTSASNLHLKKAPCHAHDI